MRFNKSIPFFLLLLNASSESFAGLGRNLVHSRAPVVEVGPAVSSKIPVNTIKNMTHPYLQLLKSQAESPPASPVNISTTGIRHGQSAYHRSIINRDIPKIVLVKDLRESGQAMHRSKIANQAEIGSTGTCYTHAGSKCYEGLLRMHEIVPPEFEGSISANLQTGRAPAPTQPARGGRLASSLSHIHAEGMVPLSPIEKDLAVSDHGDQSLSRILNPVWKEQQARQTKSESSLYSDPKFEKHRLLVEEMITPHDPEAPGGGSDSFLTGFTKALRGQHPSTQVHRLPGDLNLRTVKAPEDKRMAIQQNFDRTKPYPMPISINASILKNAGTLSEKEAIFRTNMHSVLLIGRRYKKDGTPQVLIRNSWGSAPEKVVKDLETDNGDVWIDEKRVLDHSGELIIPSVSAPNRETK
jgi:hypothetical protein